MALNGSAVLHRYYILYGLLIYTSTSTSITSSIGAMI
jgi:hypothetical protein